MKDKRVNPSMLCLDHFPLQKSYGSLQITSTTTWIYLKGQPKLLNTLFYPPSQHPRNADGN